MNKATVSLSELERAVKFCKDKLHSVEITITFDINGRLVINASDLASNPVKIILYDASTSKFPEVIRQENLP